MTYFSACAKFDAMDAARKKRIIKIFDLIRLESGFQNARDAFIAAVEDECKAIETESVIVNMKGRMQ